MSIALLDLNDCNVQLWHQGAHLQSPGYALLQGKDYVFGGAARAAARLRPRDINTRYWWQLSTEPLQPALGPARHTADLVHAQLLEMHREAQQPAEMLLAVSGTMQQQQLSLLLGIMQQCPFDAVGLVNRSVALGSLYPQGERLFHLEVQLHQSVISELARQDNMLQLQRTVPLPGCGLLQLQERLVEIIATAFVRQTRFDPRRKADSEQVLYDALPTALRTLQHSNEANLDINGYQARVSNSELRAAGSRLFDSARDTIGALQPEDRIVAEPLAGLMPGLSEEIQQLDIVPSEDLQRALQLHQEQLVQRGQALNFVTALPCLGQKTESARAGNTAATTTDSSTPGHAPPPTHLLKENRATPLIAGGTALDGDQEIYRDEHGWRLRGSTPAASVNGNPGSAGQLLVSGDSVTLDSGFHAVLIEVEDSR